MLRALYKQFTLRRIISELHYIFTVLAVRHNTNTNGNNFNDKAEL